MSQPKKSVPAIPPSLPRPPRLETPNELIARTGGRTYKVPSKDPLPKNVQVIQEGTARTHQRSGGKGPGPTFGHT